MEDLEIELRRNQDTLRIIGTGVIALGIWSVIRTLMGFLVGPAEVKDEIQNVLQDIEGMPGEAVLRAVIPIVIYTILIGQLVLDLLLRLYIGRSAMAEGKGIIKGRLYLFAAGFLAAGYFFWLILLVVGIMNTAQPVETIGALIVELTAFVTLLELIISAVRVRKLTKLLSDQKYAA